MAPTSPPDTATGSGPGDRARPAPLVLSIQSDVIHGHVGNAAARPVFHALGISTLCLPSVLLAHHPGHGPTTGRPMAVDDLRDLVDGLARAGILDRVDAVLSGYLASADQVAFVADLVALVRERSPRALYWCDPVMGDEPKGLYVRDEVAEAIRQVLVPRADMITPNAFEARWLTGPTQGAAQGAAQGATQAGGPLGDWLMLAGLDTPEAIITSVRVGSDIGALWRRGKQSWFAATPRRADVPGGMGDTFTALALGLTLLGRQPEDALNRAVRALARLLDLGPAPGLPPELPLVAGAAILRQAAFDEDF